jgi:hypothetical protein
MRKNAEDFGVRGVVETALSLHVNGEQSSATVGSCQNIPSVFQHSATRETSTHTIFVVTSFYFLPSSYLLFLSSLHSFMLLCKEEEEEF